MRPTPVEASPDPFAESSPGTSCLTRRSMLAASAPLVLAPFLPGAAAPPAPRRPAPTGAARTVPEGRKGEFDFLAGEWRIAHRMRKAPTSDEWLEFPGEATCWTILDGAGSVEDLRVPTRNFRGMGLRLLDIKAKLWSDFWVNAASGVLTTPGTTGGFVDGVGTFVAEEEEGGKPLWTRGVWDEITPRSCRWHQGFSRDGGVTWTDTWVMHWTRV